MEGCSGTGVRAGRWPTAHQTPPARWINANAVPRDLPQRGGELLFDGLLVLLRLLDFLLVRLVSFAHKRTPFWKCPPWEPAHSSPRRRRMKCIPAPMVATARRKEIRRVVRDRARAWKFPRNIRILRHGVPYILPGPILNDYTGREDYSAVIGFRVSAPASRKVATNSV